MNTSLSLEQIKAYQEIDRDLEQLKRDSSFFNVKNEEIDSLNRCAVDIADNLCEILESANKGVFDG